MRPLQVPTIDPAVYDPSAQLARVVGQQRVEQDPPARMLSVGEYAAEAQQILDDAWVANAYEWKTEADAEAWAADLASMGEGWKEATAALLDAYGPYCAFCEVPLPTAPELAHLAARTRFPPRAFAVENLLPACPVCRALKADLPDQATLKTDTAGALAALADPTRFAWPNSYWSKLPSTAVLPVRYDLVFVARDAERIERVRLVLPTEYPTILAAWAGGRMQERDGLLEVEGAPYPLAAHVAPSGGEPAAGIEAVIALCELNQVIERAGVPVDRRVAARTRTFLEALALRESVDLLARNGGDVSAADFLAVARGNIAATGFWGVWLTVLADVPGIQPLLAEVFPGTAPVTWIL